MDVRGLLEPKDGDAQGLTLCNDLTDPSVILARLLWLEPRYLLLRPR
jgi:hypothetical protein